MFGFDLYHGNYSKETLNAVMDSQLIFLKATEGRTFRDPKMENYIEEFGKHYENTKRIPYFGFYHFAHSTKNTPESEAHNFFEKVQPYLPALLALDIEAENERNKDIKKWIDAFEKELRKLISNAGLDGERGDIIIYTNASCSKRENFKDIDKDWWIADYGNGIKQPRTSKHWIIWQMHSDRLGLDIDYVKISPEMLQTYAMG